MPRPVSTSASNGSAAASPQMPTGFPVPAAALAGSRPCTRSVYLPSGSSASLPGSKVSVAVVPGREVESVFIRHGITRINATGEALDPNRHQAMMEVPTNDAEPGTVVQEIQAGYMIKDRLLRPALVGVTKKPD